MPEKNNENPGSAGMGVIPNSHFFTNVIEAVKQPIGLFTLVLLLLFVVIVVMVVKHINPQQASEWILPGVLVIFGGTFFAFVGVLIYDPARLYQPRAEAVEPVTDNEPAQTEMFKEPDAPPPQAKPDEWDAIFGVDKPPPDMDGWYRKLRPTLHQASFYTVPTYYLDPDLHILDFNVAFELLFRDIAGRLRGRHVNWLINKLQNSAAVFSHGQKFTERVKLEKRFPFVDLEPIVYDSPGFGRVTFTKVASQLHNADGRLQGWAVALMIRTLADWDKFERDLEAKLFQDKLWSVYAAPYDRILPKFPPYLQLIREVTSVLTSPGMSVADLGAGTGNVTQELVKQGHRVYAVENNVGMLDRLATKTKGNPNVNLVKASVDHLDCFKDQIFDAVVMVNVLYALDDPPQCLREISRILKPGGLLGFSTTHRETDLNELLQAIQVHGKQSKAGGQFLADFDILERVNREIERTIARRHTRQQYRQWVETAGFEVIRQIDSTYHNAVMLMHARKRN